jgi:branched-chain amino acid transport system permease protein
MSRRALASFLIAGVAMAFVPNLRSALDFPVFYLIFLYSLFFWVTQATSWNILTGYSGYFSFGQAAFFGVGVYTAAILVQRYGIAFFATLPAAGIVATALAAMIGFLAFRLRALRGEVFALLTLAVTFVLTAFAGLNSFVDGGQGRRISVPDYPSFLGSYPDFIYRVGLVMAIASVAVAYAIQHSRFGRGLFAIRDDEDVAEALGTPTLRYKMLVLSLSGFLAGAAGGIHSLQISYITIGETFNFTVPLFVILMSVLGGRNHWLGPVIGATVVYTLRDRLAGAGFEAWSQILLGTILILAIIFAPEGLYPRVRERLRLVVFVGVLALAVEQVWDIGGAALDQITIAMLVVLPVLLVPTRLLRWAGWLRPTPLSVDREARRPATWDRESLTMRTISPEATTNGEGDSGTGPLLQCEHIRMEFDGLQALQDVDVSISAGEIVGLVGPNGSGKSTLINVMSGMFAPTSGSVRFRGKDITGRPPHVISNLGIARTYQIPRPFATMTVLENVAVACMFRHDGMSRSEAQHAAWEYLEFTGLVDVADTLPSGVNLHQRKFLELARALASEPEVLMLDEVLSGLNPTEIDESVEMIRRVHESGHTIVIVEHLMRVVTDLASRMVVLNYGRLLAEGTPDDVMNDREVVKAYLGRDRA